MCVVAPGHRVETGGFEWVEPTGRRERDGGKAQPAAGRDLLLSRPPGSRVRKEDQMAALTIQAREWLVVLGDTGH
jgi:hypothetical protein